MLFFSTQTLGPLSFSNKSTSIWFDCQAKDNGSTSAVELIMEDDLNGCFCVGQNHVIGCSHVFFNTCSLYIFLFVYSLKKQYYVCIIKIIKIYLNIRPRKKYFKDIKKNILKRENWIYTLMYCIYQICFFFWCVVGLRQDLCWDSDKLPRTKWCNYL